MIPGIKKIEDLDLSTDTNSWEGELKNYLNTKLGRSDGLKIYSQLHDIIVNRKDDGTEESEEKWKKKVSTVLDKYKKQYLIYDIEDIVKKGKDWKENLKDILKEDKLDNLYFYLSQSILEDGNDRGQNDYLEYLNRVPLEFLKKLKQSTLELVYNLIRQNEVDVYADKWLTDEHLYTASNNKPEDLEYIIKAIIFLSDDSKLQYYGDPEQAPKLLDNDGGLLKTESGRYLSAYKIKSLLQEWQKQTGDRAVSKSSKNRKRIFGADILRNQLKVDKLDIDDIVKYIKNIYSLKDTLKSYSNEYIKNLISSDLIDLLSNRYESIKDVESLNKDISKMVINIIRSIRAR